MASVKVVLNYSEVSNFLRNDEMQRYLANRANQIVSSCGNDGYTVTTSRGQRRANATIRVTSWKAYNDNLINNTILKALK